MSALLVLDRPRAQRGCTMSSTRPTDSRRSRWRFRSSCDHREDSGWIDTDVPYTELRELPALFVVAGGFCVPRYKRHPLEDSRRRQEAAVGLWRPAIMGVGGTIAYIPMNSYRPNAWRLHNAEVLATGDKDAFTHHARGTHSAVLRCGLLT